VLDSSIMMGGKDAGTCTNVSVLALQTQTSRPQGASEMQMVAAVSQATRAAAEAATAAAGAAAICIIDPRASTGRPARYTSRKSSRRRQSKPAGFSSSSEDVDHPTPSPA